jgi:hypothetical protein
MKIVVKILHLGNITKPIAVKTHSNYELSKNRLTWNLSLTSNNPSYYFPDFSNILILCFELFLVCFCFLHFLIRIEINTELASNEELILES